METLYRKENYRTPLGAILTSSQIHLILNNPNYVAADGLIYDYYAALGCKMAKPREAFDGKHGIIAYGRGRGSGKGTHRRKRIILPPENWIIAVGHHQPIIDSKTFLSVQNRFGKNKIDKTRKHKIGILRGVLRCSCGRLMRTKYKYDKEYDVEYKHYYCPNYNPQNCSIKMVRLNELDNEVIRKLIEISLDSELIDQYVSPVTEIPYIRPRASAEQELKTIDNKITNLTAALANTEGSTAAKYIIANIEKLDKQVSNLKKEIYQITLAENKVQHREVDKAERYKKVCYIVSRLDTADYDEINGLICELFSECIWDGNKLQIKL